MDGAEQLLAMIVSDTKLIKTIVQSPVRRSADVYLMLQALDEVLQWC